MSETPYALECLGLVKHYAGLTVLRGVDLRARSGQLIALLGPSGCGKTTTLRMIAGFEPPDDGQIAVDGRIVASPQVFVPAEARRVGMVFQDYALFPHLNIADNISFGLRGSTRDKTERTRQMLDLVGLDGLDKRMPHELSGGQQQRVALARALAPQPSALLLDEPFSNLDTALRSQVRAEVAAILRQAQITTILVTHDQEEAMSLADVVAVMFDGQIAQTASPQTLYRQPVSRAVAAFIGEANFIEGHAQGQSAESPLGQILLDAPAHGSVDLLIRPEQIALVDGDGVPAQVVWREFYGHDQRVGLRLAHGLTLVARLDGSQSITPETTVHLRIQGACRPFGK